MRQAAPFLPKRLTALLLWFDYHGSESGNLGAHLNAKCPFGLPLKINVGTADRLARRGLPHPDNCVV